MTLGSERTKLDPDIWFESDTDRLPLVVCKSPVKAMKRKQFGFHVRRRVGEEVHLRTSSESLPDSPASSPTTHTHTHTHIHTPTHTDPNADVVQRRRFKATANIPSVQQGNKSSFTKGKKKSREGEEKERQSPRRLQTRRSTTRSWDDVINNTTTIEEWQEATSHDCFLTSLRPSVHERRTEMPIPAQVFYPAKPELTFRELWTLREKGEKEAEELLSVWLSSHQALNIVGEFASSRYQSIRFLFRYETLSNMYEGGVGRHHADVSEVPSSLQIAVSMDLLQKLSLLHNRYSHLLNPLTEELYRAIFLHPDLGDPNLVNRVKSDGQQVVALNRSPTYLGQCIALNEEITKVKRAIVELEKQRGEWKYNCQLVDEYLAAINRVVRKRQSDLKRTTFVIWRANVRHIHSQRRSMDMYLRRMVKLKGQRDQKKLFYLWRMQVQRLKYDALGRNLRSLAERKHLLKERIEVVDDRVEQHVKELDKLLTAKAEAAHRIEVLEKRVYNTSSMIHQECGHRLSSTTVQTLEQIDLVLVGLEDRVQLASVIEFHDLLSLSQYIVNVEPESVPFTHLSQVNTSNFNDVYRSMPVEGILLAWFNRHSHAVAVSSPFDVTYANNFTTDLNNSENLLRAFASFMPSSIAQKARQGIREIDLDARAHVCSGLMHTADSVVGKKMTGEVIVNSTSPATIATILARCFVKYFDTQKVWKNAKATRQLEEQLILIRQLRREIKGAIAAAACGTIMEEEARSSSLAAVKGAEVASSDEDEDKEEGEGEGEGEGEEREKWEDVEKEEDGSKPSLLQPFSTVSEGTRIETLFHSHSSKGKDSFIKALMEPLQAEEERKRKQEEEEKAEAALPTVGAWRPSHTASPRSIRGTVSGVGGKVGKDGDQSKHTSLLSDELRSQLIQRGSVSMSNNRFTIMSTSSSSRRSRRSTSRVSGSKLNLLQTAKEKREKEKKEKEDARVYLYSYSPVSDSTLCAFGSRVLRLVEAVRPCLELQEYHCAAWRELVGRMNAFSIRALSSAISGSPDFVTDYRKMMLFRRLFQFEHLFLTQRIGISGEEAVKAVFQKCHKQLMQVYKLYAQGEVGNSVTSMNYSEFRQMVSDCRLGKSFRSKALGVFREAVGVQHDPADKVCSLSGWCCVSFSLSFISFFFLFFFILFLFHSLTAESWILFPLSFSY